MSYLDFSIYNGTKQYFKLYDVYIKTSGNNKEDLYYKLCINNSSYRRARETEQRVGKEIIHKLSKFFSFKVPKEATIKELQNVANRIYDNLYFKIYDTYEEDLEYINNLLNHKSLLFPILNLLKLFMLVNNKSPRLSITEDKELYNNVAMYWKFFTPELNEILEILGLFFEDNVHDEWSHNYNNAMAYQILASKYYVQKKYPEAILFATKSKEMLIADSNFMRYFTNNRTLMNCLLFVGNYEECNIIAAKQLLAVKALNYSEYEKEIAEDFLYVSLLGLMKYEYIIEKLKDQDDFYLNRLTCLLVSLYATNKSSLNQYIKENINYDELDDYYCEYIKGLIYYLNHKDKKLLGKLEKYDVIGSIFEILKKNLK